jgi:hypothetical protein
MSVTSSAFFGSQMGFYWLRTRLRWLRCYLIGNALGSSRFKGQIVHVNLLGMTTDRAGASIADRRMAVIGFHLRCSTRCGSQARKRRRPSEPIWLC